MTKEEYLNMYKEDKLAEICAQLEEERDYYHDEMNAYKSDAQAAQKKADDFSSYWESVDRLFEKLRSIPVKDFIKLYYMMQGMMNNQERYDNTCIPNPNNWDKITTVISSRQNCDFFWRIIYAVAEQTNPKGIGKDER